MTYRPIMPMLPSATSNHFIFIWVSIGSIKLVQREHVAKLANVTETVEILAAAENNIQRANISIHVLSIFNISLDPRRKLILRTYNKSPSAADAMSVRKRTISTAGMVMRTPRIAVNPQISTRKWRCKKSLELAGITEVLFYTLL